MRFDEARLLGIPRSRRIIASFDPKHDRVFSVSPLLSKKDQKGFTHSLCHCSARVAQDI